MRLTTHSLWRALPARRRLGLAVLALGAALAAQDRGPGVVRGLFTLPEYDRQNPNKLRSLLTGVGAHPQASGLILLAGVVFQRYDELGQTNLTIRGTNCVLDARNHVVSSPDRLEVQSGDARFSIEGVGFEWRQTNSVLIVSNQVHTRLRRPEAPTAQEP